jgi:hypothetical protein
MPFSKRLIRHVHVGGIDSENRGGVFALRTDRLIDAQAMSKIPFGDRVTSFELNYAFIHF